MALQGQVGIATISRVEIIEGMREHERKNTLRLLNSLLSLPLDTAIADLAGEYIAHFWGQGITLDKPDAIIGATAVRHDLILVTYNVKHFPMSELQLYQNVPQA